MFDSDQFDVEVIADRLSASEFDRHTFAQALGVHEAHIWRMVTDGYISKPYRYELTNNNLRVAYWTAEQVAQALADREKRRKRRTTPPACGSHAAYHWHRRRKEPVDEKCMEAERVYSRERRRIQRLAKLAAKSA